MPRQVQRPGDIARPGSGKMWATPMELTPKTLTAPIGRLGAAAQNALEVARFGGLATDEQPSPYEVVVRAPRLQAPALLPGATRTRTRRTRPARPCCWCRR